MFNPINLLSKIIKSSNQRDLDKIQKIVEKVNKQESLVSKYKEKDFPKRTEELIQKVKAGVSLNDILIEAFAIVREASKRVTGERHFDVQILVGIALHQNNIAEMKTGEGKTLVATLPVYLNYVMENKAVIVTVNDY